MGTCGCFNCGNNRFDPIDIEDENGDMILKCMECGTTLVVSHAFQPGVPDKNGNAISKECLRGLSEKVRNNEQRRASEAASTKGV